jgi:HD-like signal output (HDOD) protein
MPFLVFEYVEGVSLRDYLRQHAPVPAADAVKLFEQLLDGMAHAHGQGIVHLDLSPGNIMIDRAGVPRVMDFDLSKKVHAAVADGPVVGTPRYMTPEHFTTGRTDCRTDVYALGLIFYEMLLHRPAVTGDSQGAIVQAILNGEADLADLKSNEISARYTEVLRTALQKQPERRFRDGSVMKKALLDCGGRQLVHKDEGGGTIEFLLRRMQRRQDFPALSQTLLEINGVTANDSTAPTARLANIVLRDFAVTNKLLKLANSAFYSAFSGTVTNVSDAIRVLGMEQVRTACNALLCFTHFTGRGSTTELKDLQVRAFLAGLVSRHLARTNGLKQAEDAFICGMLHNLGRSLAIFYFGEEQEEIQALVASRGLDPEEAARAVLGINYHELGIAVAREWAFPETILATMAALPDVRLPAPATPIEALHQIASLANRLCELADRTAPETKHDALAAVPELFQAGTDLSPGQAERVLAAALDKFKEFARVLDITLDRSPFMGRLGPWLAFGSDADAAEPVQSASAAPQEPRAVHEPSADQGSVLGRWFRKGQCALGWRSG